MRRFFPQPGPQPAPIRLPLSGVVLATGMLLLGCSADEPACLTGARVCDSTRIMVCNTDQQLETLQECPKGCFDGQCIDTNYEFGQDATVDTGAPDTLDTVGAMDTSLDTEAPDLWIPSDPGGFEDAGPDLTEPLDIAPDPGPQDTGPADTGAPDTGPADTGPTDTGPTDTGPADTGPADAGPEDTGPADAGPEDTGPDIPDVGEPDAGAPPESYGPLSYEKVQNIAVTEAIWDLAWHADGAFALLLGSSGRVARYEPGQNLQLATTLSGSVSAIAADPDGGFLMVGADDGAIVWRIDETETGLEFVEQSVSLLGDAVEVIHAGVPLTWIIGTRQKNGGAYINRVIVWHETKGILAQRAYPQSGDPVDSYAGLTGLMLADPAMFAGSQAVVTAEGFNGAASHTWIVETNLIIDNDWKNSFGNAGKAAWRPGGVFGFVGATSTNAVYVYDGTWQKTTTPTANNGASTNDIAWNATGTRALAVARATGSSLVGSVSEYRAQDSVGYDPLRWVNQSIPGFGDPPWNGTFSTHLTAVGWRPYSACTEGVITTNSSGLSLVIRFWDTSDTGCSSTP